MKAFELFHLEDGAWVSQGEVEGVSRRKVAAKIRNSFERKEGTWKLRLPEHAAKEAA